MAEQNIEQQIQVRRVPTYRLRDRARTRRGVFTIQLTWNTAQRSTSSYYGRGHQVMLKLLRAPAPCTLNREQTLIPSESCKR